MLKIGYSAPHIYMYMYMYRIQLERISRVRNKTMNKIQKIGWLIYWTISLDRHMHTAIQPHLPVFFLFLTCISHARTSAAPVIHE